MFRKLAPVAALLAFTAVQPTLATLQLASRATSDVFVPPVTYPTAGTVWSVGQTLNVTWDISNAPQNVTNTKGLILIRKGGVTTPLTGNSGNVSPDFTITGSGVAF